MDSEDSEKKGQVQELIMFFSNKQKVKQEILIKESLLSQLSNTVKEVQLLNSQNHEVFDTNEATNTLIVVLESIFLHGLKRGIFKDAMATVGGTEDTKPQPSFWSAVSYYTHKDTLISIKKLKHITTDVGRSRAWVRLTLNQAELTSYLQAMLRDRRPINSSYNNIAFLRDRDILDTALQLLEGVIMIPFDIPTNSSLLNKWSNEPLMLSGIWSPSLKSTPIHSGVDVAEAISSEEETSSIKTASSMSSLAGILTLDENQALKLILESSFKPAGVKPTVVSPIPNGQEAPKSESSSSSPSSSSSFLAKIQETDDRQREPVSTGNSLVNTTGWSSIDEVEENMEEEEEEEEIVHDVQLRTKDVSYDNRTFSNLLETYGSPAKTINYSEILSRMEPTEKKDTSDSEYEVVSSATDSDQLEDYLLKIPMELGLNLQKYTCWKCQLSIGLHFDSPVLCHYTKKYYCTNCHENQTIEIPSRIIYNWDHKKYPVSKEAYKYLQEVANNPLVDIKTCNIKLYRAVNEMKDMNHIRLQLYLLRAYLFTCKEPVLNELRKKLWPREYLYEQIHMYSISDLKKVPGGGLANELQPVVDFARKHVLGCRSCEKGYICDICKNPKVIYPFDCHATYRCNKCLSVYHGDCLKKTHKCPKCHGGEKKNV